MAGDGRQGWPALAPFDAIHVGAAAPELPRVLVGQLAKNGRMVIPVGPAGGMQALKVVTKLADGSCDVWGTMGVSYIPLTSKVRL